MEAITMIKSNTFHGIVKYLKFKAINFIPHSIVNLNQQHHHRAQSFTNV